MFKLVFIRGSKNTHFLSYSQMFHDIIMFFLFVIIIAYKLAAKRCETDTLL